MRTVVLVDKHGNAIGAEEILKAHTLPGSLHKAFSVCIFRNERSELLIQQRSKEKLLFPLFWANSCCSHPLEGEGIIEAGERRLQEELGFTCPLTEAGSFVYRAEDPEGRGVEHEHDTVLVGDIEEVDVQPNPEEIADWKWVTIDELIADLDENPEVYAPWFSQALAVLFEGS